MAKMKGGLSKGLVASASNAASLGRKGGKQSSPKKMTRSK